MSSSSSTESPRLIENQEINPELLLSPSPNGNGQQKFTNNHGFSDEVSENFNKLAKVVNSKSNEYAIDSHDDKSIEASSDIVAATDSEAESNSITNKMNNALDVFFQFEDTVDSESRECSEFQTERAIIREMCNVVIKKLDFNKEWGLES